MEPADASEPEDGEILDENEGSEFTRSEDEGEYEQANRPSHRKYTRTRKHAGGYGRSRVDHFTKNTEAYRRSQQAKMANASSRQPLRSYSRSHSKGSPHDYPRYSTIRSKDRRKVSVGPVNRVGGSSNQGRFKTHRYSLRSIRKMARDKRKSVVSCYTPHTSNPLLKSNTPRKSIEKRSNDQSGTSSKSQLEKRRKRFQEGHGTDSVRVGKLIRTCTQLNGVNNQIVAGSSRDLNSTAQGCSNNQTSTINVSTRQSGTLELGLPPHDVEPVSDDDDPVSAITEADVAAGKKSPLIITLSSTDTSEDDEQDAKRELHRQNIVTDDNKIISIVSPVEYPRVETTPEDQLDNDQEEDVCTTKLPTKNTQDAAIQSLTDSAISLGSNTLAAIDPPSDEDMRQTINQESTKEIEVDEEENGGSRDSENSEVEDDIYVLELRNQLLADLVEKTVKQESANATTKSQKLDDMKQTEKTESNTNTGDESSTVNADDDTPDEEESALREVLLSQMANKRRQLRSDKNHKSSIEKPSKDNTANEIVGGLQLLPEVETYRHQQQFSSQVTPSNTERSLQIRQSQVTTTPINRRGATTSRGRRGRKNRTQPRNKSELGNHIVQSSQLSPNLGLDAHNHRVVRVDNETLRNQPHVINRPANLKNLPDNDLRNKLLRNRRNEQQQQAQDTSIISLFPDFGIADTDMRKVDVGDRVLDMISDMTIRRTVNFETNQSTSTTTSSTAITYMAPINVDIPSNDIPHQMPSPCLIRMQNEAAHLRHHSQFIQSTPSLDSTSHSPYMHSPAISTENPQVVHGSPVSFLPNQTTQQGHGDLVGQPVGQFRTEVNYAFGYPTSSVTLSPAYTTPADAQLLPPSTIHSSIPGLVMSVPGFHGRIPMGLDVDQRIGQHVGAPIFFTGNMIPDNHNQITLSTNNLVPNQTTSMESNIGIQEHIGVPTLADLPVSTPRYAHVPILSSLGILIPVTTVGQDHISGERVLESGRVYQGTVQIINGQPVTHDSSNHSPSAFHENLHPAADTTDEQVADRMSDDAELEYFDRGTKGERTEGVNVNNLTHIRTRSSPSMSVARSLANVAVSSSGRSQPIVSSKEQDKNEEQLQNDTLSSENSSAKETGTTLGRDGTSRSSPSLKYTSKNRKSNSKLDPVSLSADTLPPISPAQHTNPASLNSESTAVVHSTRSSVVAPASSSDKRPPMADAIRNEKNGGNQLQEQQVSRRDKESSPRKIKGVTPTAAEFKSEDVITCELAGDNVPASEDNTSRPTCDTTASSAPYSNTDTSVGMLNPIPTAEPSTSGHVRHVSPQVSEGSSVDSLALVNVSSKKQWYDANTTPIFESSNVSHIFITSSNTGTTSSSTSAFSETGGESSVNVSTSSYSAITSPFSGTIIASSGSSFNSPDALPEGIHDPALCSSLEPSVNETNSGTFTLEVPKSTSSSYNKTPSPGTSSQSASSCVSGQRPAPRTSNLPTGNAPVGHTDTENTREKGCTSSDSTPNVRSPLTTSTAGSPPVNKSAPASPKTPAQVTRLIVTPPTTSPTGRELKVRNPTLLELCAVSPNRESTYKDDSIPPPDSTTKSGAAACKGPASSTKIDNRRVALERTLELSKLRDAPMKLITNQKPVKSPQNLPKRTTPQNLTNEVVGAVPPTKYTPKPIATTGRVPPKSNTFVVGFPKPKPVTPVVIHVTEGDTTEDEEDDDNKTGGGDSNCDRRSKTQNTTSSDPSNPMFQSCLDNFLKNCRDNMDKLENEKTQEVKKNQDTSSKTSCPGVFTQKQKESNNGTPPKDNVGAGIKTRTSPVKTPNTMQVVLLREGNTETTSVENEGSKLAISRKRQRSPSIVATVQCKRRTVSGETYGISSTSLQLPRTSTPVNVPPSNTSKFATSGSGTGNNAQDTPANSKAVIESLTDRVTETRNQIHLSLKEKELIQSRQNCYNEFRGILRDLQHHTRISNLENRLGQDIFELEKKLATLKKKQEAAQQKGSDLNKSIKEKSKNALTHKTSCLLLANDVKKLGEKVIGDKKYKVPDILVENINELMRSLKNMDIKQPENLQRERGVPFKQLILDEGAFSSSTPPAGGSQQLTPAFPVVPPPPSKTVIATSSQVQLQKKKPMTTAVDIAILKSMDLLLEEDKARDDHQEEAAQIVAQNVQMNIEKEGKEDGEESSPGTSQKINQYLTRRSTSDCDDTDASEGKEEDEPVHESVNEERLPLSEGDVLSAVQRIGYNNAEHADDGSSILQIFNTNGLVRLDPHTPICPASLSDGICTRENCKLQHI